MLRTRFASIFVSNLTLSYIIQHSSHEAFGQSRRDSESLWCADCILANPIPPKNQHSKNGTKTDGPHSTQLSGVDYSGEEIMYVLNPCVTENISFPKGAWPAMAQAGAWHWEPSRMKKIGASSQCVTAVWHVTALEVWCLNCANTNMFKPERHGVSTGTGGKRTRLYTRNWGELVDDHDYDRCKRHKWDKHYYIWPGAMKLLLSGVNICAKQE